MNPSNVRHARRSVWPARIGASLIWVGALSCGQASDSGPAPTTGSGGSDGSGGGAIGAGGQTTGGQTGTSGAAGSNDQPGSGGATGTGGGNDTGAGGSDGTGGGWAGTSSPGFEAGVTQDGGTPVTMPTTGSMGPLAAKPYMGWSSWSSTTGNITETKVKAVADIMVSKLMSLGYQYINIDDGWYSGFDANGRWKPDTRKFPDGIKGTADYLHSKGLLIGVYLTPGINDTAVNANSAIEGTAYHVKDIVTSGAGSTDKASGATSKKIDYSKPGAVEYVQGYANLLAGWGVDFIKMDFVGPGGGGGNADNQDDIKQWRAALDKSGRNIWLELSNMLNISAIQTWKTYSNGWRVANDVESYSTNLTNWTHVVRVINAVPPFAQYSGPGSWNDLDSLEIGVGAKDGITADERQTVFSYWAMHCAPLYIGADITSLDPADLAILTNSEVIAVDQAAVPPKAASGNQVWYSKQKDGSIVVGLFNLNDASGQVSASFSAVGAASSMNVRDLVTHTDLGMSSGSFSASLAAHGSRMIKLTP